MKLIPKIIIGLCLLMMNGIMKSIPVIPVTNRNDAGPGSLRQAVIESSELYQNPDEFPFQNIIIFEIAGNIRLKTDIHIAHRVIIDGWTAPGALVNTNPHGMPNNEIKTISIVGGRLIRDPGSEGSAILGINESMASRLKTEEQYESMQE